MDGQSQPQRASKLYFIFAHNVLLLSGQHVNERNAYIEIQFTGNTLSAVESNSITTPSTNYNIPFQRCSSDSTRNLYTKCLKLRTPFAVDLFNLIISLVAYYMTSLLCASCTRCTDSLSNSLDSSQCTHTPLATF